MHHSKEVVKNIQAQSSDERENRLQIKEEKTERSRSRSRTIEDENKKLQDLKTEIKNTKKDGKQVSKAIKEEPAKKIVNGKKPKSEVKT